MSDGTTVKIPVEETGIYKITYSYLKEVEGLNIDAANPAAFQLFGNGGGAISSIIRAGYDNHNKDLIENI
ncbi:MAG: hypothetical protein R2769_12610 [Saprospiraceae bacterium]